MLQNSPDLSAFIATYTQDDDVDVSSNASSLIHFTVVLVSSAFSDQVIPFLPCRVHQVIGPFVGFGDELLLLLVCLLLRPCSQ